MTITTTEAAAQAGVTVATIRTWCRIGAVAAAKTGRRWVIEAASLARRIALTAKPKKVVYSIETMTAIGGSEWIRGDKHRVYINGWTNLIGLEVNHYKSGNIASAFLNGEEISNSEAYRLLGTVNKVYFDAADGKVYISWGHSAARTMDREDIAAAIFTGIRAAIAAL
jgi:excisionase family DNA binding protein